MALQPGSLGGISFYAGISTTESWFERMGIEVNDNKLIENQRFLSVFGGWNQKFPACFQIFPFANQNRNKDLNQVKCAETNMTMENPP